MTLFKGACSTLGLWIGDADEELLLLFLASCSFFSFSVIGLLITEVCAEPLNCKRGNRSLFRSSFNLKAFSTPSKAVVFTMSRKPKLVWVLLITLGLKMTS